MALFCYEPRLTGCLKRPGLYPEYFMIASATPPLSEREGRLTRGLGFARLVMAAVGAVALVARYIWGLGSATFEPGNYFGYLTIQSNLLFVIICVATSIPMVRARLPQPWVEALRAAVLTCTITSGIVFALIVQQSSLRAIRVDVPWSDVVLHFILPVFALLDWMLSPRVAPAPRRIILVVIGYTLGWGGVTMIRGGITGWYPYYFLDPNQTDGIAEFLLLSGAALLVFTLAGTLVVGVSAVAVRLRRRAAGSAGLPREGRRRSAPR
jgi:hypothetical protein